ncbi:hypothetical protein [Estrella lausannensis]|uniref:hypothetical protein n=1 Tax=Estrella lausannensis TaxID=483423 RepID=UPI00117B2D64|nr:hypothetical protein [Estrella lausannensis]
MLALRLYYFREKSFTFSLFFFPLILFHLLGCSHSDESFLRERGKASLSALLQELQGITKREDALDRESRLAACFEEVAETAIALREKGLVLDQVVQEGDRNLSLQKKILIEMERIYQIDGCPEIIEKAEETALFKLDLHEYEREMKLKKKERKL